MTCYDVIGQPLFMFHILQRFMNHKNRILTMIRKYQKAAVLWLLRITYSDLYIFMILYWGLLIVFSHKAKQKIICKVSEMYIIVP